MTSGTAYTSASTTTTLHREHGQQCHEHPGGGPAHHLGIGAHHEGHHRDAADEKCDGDAEDESREHNATERQQRRKLVPLAKPLEQVQHIERASLVGLARGVQQSGREHRHNQRQREHTQDRNNGKHHDDHQHDDPEHNPTGRGFHEYPPTAAEPDNAAADIHRLRFHR